MFNKKYKNKINELETVIHRKNETITRQLCKMYNLKFENEKYEKEILNLKDKIKQLENKLELPKIICDEELKKTKKSPKKSSK